MEYESFATSLTDAFSVAILLNLYDTGRKMSLTQLGGEVFNYTSLRKRVARFEEEGLVTISLEKDPKKVVYVSLTPKGRKVGAQLDSMRKILPPGDFSKSPMCMKYAVPVVVMLYRYGPLKHNDFLTTLGSYVPIIKKLLPALEEDGIVTQWVKEDGRHSTMVRLTDMGRDAGALMEEAVRIIGKK